MRSLGPDRDQYLDLMVRLGTMGIPSLANRNFVLSVVFGASSKPKARFAWLFPDADHALVHIRPQPGLNDEQMRGLGRGIRRLADRSGLPQDRLEVAGAPLLVAATSTSFVADVLRLSPLALLLLVLVLLGGFRGGRQRLRLLLVAGGAVLLTAAASRVLGLGLTPATIAALPVVLGIAVDFGVQLQARFRAERRDGLPAALAARCARDALLPTLGLATAAMSIGFLVLLLSPTPLIDRLGLLLVIGTVASLLLVMVAGPPLLAWRASSEAARPPAIRPPSSRRGLPASRLLPLLVGVALAGIVVAGGTRVQSDLFELAPSGLDEAQQLKDVQRTLGTGGVLRLAVTSDDVLAPSVLRWQREAVRRAAATDRRLRPGPNVADVLLGEEGTADAAQVRRLARLVPSAFLDAVVTRDGRRAEISFGMPPVPVAEQAEVLERIESALRPLPPGVSVTPVGLVARGVESVDDLESSRPLLLLIALAGTLLLLLAVRRSWERALVPLVPTFVVAGVSAFALRALDVELSPLGAGLEPLVLAVGVEFGLLLEARYREARALGRSPLGARDEAIRSVGGAVAVSALAVGLAFAALAASRLGLLQQFGVLVAVEVLLCAAVAIWAVPGLLAVLDQRRDRAGREPSVSRGVPAEDARPSAARVLEPAR